MPENNEPSPSKGDIIPLELKELIEKTLDDAKATDITVLDIQGKSSIADYIIVATGASTRQVASLSDKIIDTVKPFVSVRSEGKAQGDWVLVDASSVIVHLFRPEVREFYNIERIWSMGNTEKEIVEIRKK